MYGEIFWEIFSFQIHRGFIWGAVGCFQEKIIDFDFINRFAFFPRKILLRFSST